MSVHDMQGPQETSDGFMVQCSCGWVSNYFASSLDASSAHTNHLLMVQTQEQADAAALAQKIEDNLQAEEG